MNPTELLKSALTTMRLNKRRTFLTMFGIVIGIASVITILSLGNGFRQETLTSLAKDMEGRRSQEFYFASTDFEIDYDNLEPYSQKNLNDIRAMDGVSDVKFTDNSQDMDESIYSNFSKLGKNEMFSGKPVNSSKETLLAGRNLSTTDNHGKRRYIVVSTTITNLFFEGLSPEEVIHRSIDMDDKTYTIVGVFETLTPEEDNSFINVSFFENPEFYIPQETYDLTQEDTGSSFSITVYFEQEADMKKLSKDISKYLEENGKEKNSGTYSYFDMSEMMDQIGAVLNNITYFITAIAGISLFIAGVGVMNMMYISVSERTKEIGIRRSLGATAKSIQWQFLLEGIAISLFGGVLGYVLGIALSYLVALLLPFSAAPDLMSALFAISVSTLIGIIFSVFPAKTAANKNVVEILR